LLNVFLQADIEAVAHAEAYEQDPLKSHRAQTPATADAYGIGSRTQPAERSPY